MSNCFWGLLIETSNFAFEVKDILGLESTHLECQVAIIGLNGPQTNNFAFEVKATLGLESTHLEIWVAKIGLNGPHD